MEKDKNLSTYFKEWLDKLQQESWQLELLISGFALFAIWEAGSIIGLYQEYLSVNISPDIRELNIVLQIIGWTMNVGWRIFFINLTLHIVIRSLWIGAIGLRYVSQDIDYEKLNYSEHFTNYFKRTIGSFDDFIERLERFASTLFAYAFLMGFLFLSFTLFLAFVAVFFVIMIRLTGEMGLFFSIVFLLIFSIISLILAIDFITLGVFKQIKDRKFSRFYFYLYRFISLITLSFIYRPILLNFIDEKYTRRLFWLSIPYILILVIIPGVRSEPSDIFPLIARTGNVPSLSIQQESVFSYFYDDEREKLAKNEIPWVRDRRRIRILSLSSSTFSGSHGRLFLRFGGSDERLFEEEDFDLRKRTIWYNSWDNTYQDEASKKLMEERDSARIAVYRNRRTLVKALEENEVDSNTLGLHRVDGEMELNETYWNQLRDSTLKMYNDEIADLKKAKIGTIKDAYLGLCDISIDNISYNDSISTKFYIHPNMGERGILVYFPLDGLSIGEHTLHLNRIIYDNDQPENMGVRNYYVPFWVVEEE